MDYLRLQQAAMVFIVMYVKFVVEVVVDRSQDADALAADGPGADLPAGDAQQVDQVEPAPAQVEHPGLLAPDHRGQEQVLGGLLVLVAAEQGLGAARHELLPRLGGVEGAVQA